MKFWERLGIGIMSLWLLYAIHEGVNALVRAHNWQPMTISDWGTWIGSIGTVGALIGTIWLATAEQRKRARDDLMLARLRGAAMKFRVEAAYIKVQDATFVLTQAARADCSADDFRACWNTLNQIDLWTIEEVIPLIPLPRSTALALSEAVAHIVMVRNSIQNGLSLDTNEKRSARAESVLSTLEGVSKLMSDAIGELWDATFALHLES